MAGPQATLLPGGKRLHLHHGPIDLIIEAWGEGRNKAYRRAIGRFETVLEELVGELPLLRAAAHRERRFEGPVARRMQRAVTPLAATFITPMAAVAGAVADEILAHLTKGGELGKAYVNNGGDIAFHLVPGQHIEAAIAASGAGRITIRAGDPFRGMATSGWRGRSHSLGIADQVSVIAANAATADAAATRIANAVDLPGHGAIARTPATELSPDSDLGDRLVTTAVGPLSVNETAEALRRGAGTARRLLEDGRIGGALLTLNAQTRQIGAAAPITEDTGELIHA